MTTTDERKLAITKSTFKRYNTEGIYKKGESPFGEDRKEVLKRAEHDADKANRNANEREAGDANDARLERMLDAVPNGVATLSLDELIAHEFNDKAAALRHNVTVAQNAGG